MTTSSSTGASGDVRFDGRQRGNIRSLKARRAAARLALAPAAADELLIDTDAVGAANLMQAILERGAIDAALAEDDGAWRVVVRANPDMDAVLVSVLEIVGRCIEERRLSFATLRRGDQVYTWQSAGPEDGGDRIAA
jgi:hypothetical protein